MNEHARTIHTPIVPSGLTPFQIFGKLARLAGEGIAPPDFETRDATKWTARDIQERAETVARLASHIDAMGTPSVHPWRGVAGECGEQAAGKLPCVGDGLVEIMDNAARRGDFGTAPLGEVILQRVGVKGQADQLLA